MMLFLLYIAGTGPTGPCTDVLSNCPEYSQNACHEPYVDWAKTNCRSYCGYCGMYIEDLT